MADKSKFFRVAVEGATSDGRTIERKDIDDMAATYNRDTYGARVNMEHIRGFSADGPFNAYGDVLALEARDIDMQLAGKSVKRRALFAQIEPTDTLKAINAKKQKIYTSVEIQPNFANTGKAGLVGLAVTDSPASLGCEVLQFAAGLGDKSPLAPRKQAPGNLFTEAHETAIEMEAPEAPPADPSAGFFSAAAEFFKGLTGKSGEPAAPPAPPAPPAEPANDNDKFAAIASGIEQLTQGIGAIRTEFTAQLGTLRTDLTALKTDVEKTKAPGSFSRQPATGAGAGGARSPGY